jgi:hypothetical protein
MRGAVRFGLFLGLLLLTLSGMRSTSDAGEFDRDPKASDGLVINIDPRDDSCTPAGRKYPSCAKACEINPLGCAKDILKHVESDAFIRRRQLNPSVSGQKPNIQTPMHGLFVPVWNNPQLNEAIKRAVKNPFAPVRMPNWSISVKLNNNPGTPNNIDPTHLTWATVMYKIPGYCPKNAQIFPLGARQQLCKGGEWFWFLYRGNFLSFDYDMTTDASAPAWGKGEQFCISCHGSAADTDWLWITTDLVKRAQELAKPVSRDGHAPARAGAAFCDDVTGLSPERPVDVRFDPASLGSAERANRMFNCYGWKTFVALFWPAKSNQRGEPDTTKPLTHPAPSVWETYKQTYEAFQPASRDWSLKRQDWNSPQPLPEICRSALAVSGMPAESVPTFQVLNETHQAFGSQFNNLIDQNGNEVHYNVRFNRDEFEFIKRGGFADTGAYDYSGPLGANKRLFRLPDNTDGVTGEGATEIKSAWKILCTDANSCKQVDDPSRYFTRNALIYTPAVERVVEPFLTAPLPRPVVTSPATCKLARVGLVGFHIAAKTFWAPQWIWSTFEQVDNVPGNTAPSEPPPPHFSFFDPSLTAPPLIQCLGQRPGITPMGLAMNGALLGCPNQQNIVNSSPDPANTGELLRLFAPEIFANQVSRLDPIGNTTDQSSVQQLNALFRGLLASAGSPLRYYVMVNTQWPANGRRSATAQRPFGINNKLCLDQPGAADCVTFLPASLRLRNATIETYDMAYCKPDNEDIGNDPANCTPDQVVQDPHQFSSGGCMNCHFNAGTDSSFIWADAIEAQVPIDAGPSKSASWFGWETRN